MNRKIVTEERLERIREERDVKRSKFYATVSSNIGEEAAEELSKLFGIYNEGLYIWLAGLYEPVLGGFYYSNSARDTEGFLPDLESTVQALRLIDNTGLLSSRGSTFEEAFSEKMRGTIADFARNMQSPEDGYFYHPQWGRRIGVTRRGRDNTWGLKIIGSMGSTPLYPTSLDRLSSKEKPASVPAHLSSLESFRKYLSGFELENTKSYSTGNILQAQTPQIIAAGQEYVDALFSWLDSERKPNGLWENQINYASANGLMKLSMIYTVCNHPMPNLEKSLESAIEAALSDEEITFCCQYYNPLVTINMLLGNMKKHGAPERSEYCREYLKKNAAKLIKVTREKVSRCLKKDGSFSYLPDFSAHYSQGAPVAIPETWEGDVNATQISTVGTVAQITAILGFDELPLYFEGDSELFLELLEKGEAPEKINPRPGFIDEALASRAPIK